MLSTGGQHSWHGWFALRAGCVAQTLRHPTERGHQVWSCLGAETGGARALGEVPRSAWGPEVSDLGVGQSLP